MDEATGLIESARALGVELGGADATRLLRLLDELARWNRAYNLTAIDDRREMITRHLLDSLSVAPWLAGTTIADVGTGAGFPGLPLAIASPARRFTLVDSNGKKIRFVEHAARSLGLTNVSAVHARVESLRPAAPFDTVVTRAFAALPSLLEAVAALCGPQTQVLAMKGRPTDEELRAVGASWRIVGVHSLAIPGLDEHRCAVIARPEAVTGNR